MDSNNDVDFDAYWEEESRNKNRNRIRVGRQYQASVPPLLRPGESDDRRLEDLETQYWKPSLNDQALHEYLSMAKAVSVFSCTLEAQSHDNLQSAIRGLTEFVMSHHPCHRDAGCRMSVRPNWTSKEAELLACALERCENANRRKVAEEPDESGSDDADGADDVSDIEADCQPSSTSGVELPVDVNPPSEIKPVPARVIGRKTDSPEPDVVSPVAAEAAAVRLVGAELVGGKLVGAELVGGKLVGGELVGGELVGGKLRDTCANTSQQLQDPSAAGQGSLKFYLKGQLILKLNAHQERKTWVEEPDNPAASSCQLSGGGAGVGLSAGQNRRKAGRKTHRASTTSTGIAWPERGSPSQESTSSLDSHNSTSTTSTTTTTTATTATTATTTMMTMMTTTTTTMASTTATATATTLPLSSVASANSVAGASATNLSSTAGVGSCSSSNSSNTSTSASVVSSAAQQPAPLDLSSQQS